MSQPIAALILSLALSGVAHAQVAVDAPWVRATVPQQTATGAFMRLTASRDLRLIGARSDVAQNTEVHEMAMQGQMMRMREVAAVPLPRGQAVALAPGGYHVMLIGLKRPLSAGDQVTLTLTFEDAGGKRSEQTVQAPVRPLGAGAP
ncbi:copper chaperone PCu(A)C [Lysobacter capsici]|uniref:copper chaperone PCu(A)C n=1 Tax=Lysobacter capsici TaxID=435897 RepID=UPI00287B9ADD|nr:copper chaperone PCu(A)C [Lysobacter capsici]WND80966.1 copper chaperone PCu(A)C [Lysobacter capsici]WND86162.1 copper chaperone PCu(A)C [Lysobacter capsici]